MTKLPTELEIERLISATQELEPFRPFMKFSMRSKRMCSFERMVDIITAQAARIKELEAEKARA